jgi:plastocyanin
MTGQIRRWALAGVLTLTAIGPASAQLVIPPGLGPIAAYTGLATWNRYWPAQIPSDWSTPRVSFNYQVPQVVYVPVAVQPPLPAVQPVQVTTITVRDGTAPASQRVKAGTVVTWLNAGSAARTLVMSPPAAVGGGPETLVIPAHGNFSLAFNQTGVYPYYPQGKPDQAASITVTP